MNLVLTVARREWKEQLRQPWMLFSILLLQGLVASGGPLVAWALTVADPAVLVPEVNPEVVVKSAITTSMFLGFTQYLGVAAVMAGHGVLHDRQCGTFTFLLLAPVSRRDLLLGKVLGAVAPATAIYWTTSLLGALATLPTAVARDAAWSALPGSPAFWVAWAFGGPAWSVATGTVCAAISALSADVRTAQQGSWFVVFFAALAAGTLLVWGIDQGALAGLGVAGVAAIGAALALQIGAELLGRDLAR